MKTLFSKKTNSQEVNKIEQLSKSEMNKLYGGARFISIIDKDGNVRVILVP